MLSSNAALASLLRMVRALRQRLARTKDARLRRKLRRRLRRLLRQRRHQLQELANAAVGSVTGVAAAVAFYLGLTATPWETPTNPSGEVAAEEQPWPSGLMDSGEDAAFQDGAAGESDLGPQRPHGPAPSDFDGTSSTTPESDPTAEEADDPGESASQDHHSHPKDPADPPSDNPPAGTSHQNVGDPEHNELTEQTSVPSGEDGPSNSWEPEQWRPSQPSGQEENPGTGPNQTHEECDPDEGELPPTLLENRLA
jgi:hypothetical protein